MKAVMGARAPNGSMIGAGIEAIGGAAMIAMGIAGAVPSGGSTAIGTTVMGGAVRGVTPSAVSRRGIGRRPAIAAIGFPASHQVISRRHTGADEAPAPGFPLSRE
jgi:hypothetical protein